MQFKGAPTETGRRLRTVSRHWPTSIQICEIGIWLKLTSDNKAKWLPFESTNCK
ncbi:hypothetical protein C2845_PM11G14480 [Panicum miliaceum]|uniref:Uncharacterized protein n=1 Tax=Panicum miliaceum TaxID=4540 RepID=A0A3L6RPT2_PANMI|nr:hypothetical protein C2845_PM11G14480 [Panicum miliaceum]